MDEVKKDKACGDPRCARHIGEASDQAEKLRMAAEFGQILVRENASLREQNAQLVLKLAEETTRRLEAQDSEQKSLGILRRRLADSLSRTVELEHELNEMEAKLANAEVARSSSKQSDDEEEEKLGDDQVHPYYTELKSVKQQLQQLQERHEAALGIQAAQIEKLGKENTTLQAMLDCETAKRRIAQNDFKKEIENLQREQEHVLPEPEDPMFSHFHLLVQSVRINLDRILGYSDHMSDSRELSASTLYQRAQAEDIPFYEYQRFIEQEYVRKLKPCVSGPSSVFTAA